MVTQVSAVVDRLTLLFMKSAAILLCLLGIVGWCVSGRAQAGTLNSDAPGAKVRDFSRPFAAENR